MKSEAIIGAVQGVTKKWAKQRKREEREASAIRNRQQAMTSRRHVSLKDAAWAVMEDAYLKASGGGKLPAHARQIMYAARPSIQLRTGRELGDQYFTQTLLPDFMAEYPGETERWNVVFDARGHFNEPHTEKEVALGTIEVRDYLSGVDAHHVPQFHLGSLDTSFPTLGSQHRFGAVLFIEKEGFMPLLREVRLAERYDLAIMSTKGVSVTAARQLVEKLCGDQKVTLLTLHDFDKAGFSIIGTLSRSNRRYTFESQIEVRDLGIRLEDIEDLESEAAPPVQSAATARANLRQNGATEDEIDFLLHRRVELNAFTSNQFVTWVESKLQANGISKVVPDDASLARAYRRALGVAFIQKQIDGAMEEARRLSREAEIPRDLKAAVAALLTEDPSLAWDEAIAGRACDNLEHQGGAG